MSGRRSSNPRWLVWGIAVTICSLAAAGVGLAPANSTAASSTISAVEAPRLGSAVSPSAPASLDQSPQTRGEGPRPNIKRKGPQFVVQPRLTGRTLSFTVEVNPYRTARKNRLAKPDLLRGHVDISRRVVPIRTVGLDPETRAKKLIFTAKLKQRVVKRAGRIQYQIRLPKAVARSLAATSVRNRTTRVRVVLAQAKDTDRRLPYHKTLVLAQSSLERLPTARSRAATDRLRAAPRSSDVAEDTSLNNNTPFTLQASVQPTQCVTAPQWTGTLSPGQYVYGTATIKRSGDANGLSTWQNLSKDAVTALEKAAQVAAALEIAMDPALDFTPVGVAITAVGFAADFLTRFISSALLQKTCANTPATWVTSAVAIGLPLPLWEGEYGGASWAVQSNGEPGVSGPAQTLAQLASTLGAQTSVQWNWNGGTPAANGPGASYFSGGLLQTTQALPEPPASINTMISYQNNAQNTYGPIQVMSNVTLTAVPASPAPNFGVNLTCNTGIWMFNSPWSTYTYLLSNPPNSLSSANLVTSFYYKGVDGSGNPVNGQQIPGVNSEVWDYQDNIQPQQWVNPGVIQDIIASLGGGTITGWGCSVQAQSQLPSFLLPVMWPVGGPTANLSWYSAPVNATAPNPL